MSFLATLLSRKAIELNESNLEGVTTIRDYFMFKSEYLTKVHLPSTVKELQIMAFAFCEQLSEVVFSEGLEHIADNAFAGTIKLTKISIPSTIQYIGRGAFGHIPLGDVTDALIEVNGIDNISPSCTIWQDSFGNSSPWYKSHPGAILLAQGKLLLGYGKAFENIPESVTHLAQEFMGDVSWSKQPSTLVIPDSISQLPRIWGIVQYKNDICKKVIVGAGVSKMLPGAMQVVGNTVWVCKQPKNFKVALPAPGYAAGVAYNKQATTMTLYTDNLSLIQYNWSADNVTATIKPLNEAPIN